MEKGIITSPSERGAIACKAHSSLDNTRELDNFSSSPGVDKNPNGGFFKAGGEAENGVGWSGLVRAF